MKVGLLLPMGRLAPGVPHDYAGIREVALRAQDAGLDSVWVYDHLLNGGVEDPEQSPWEAWSVLCALAEATTRVRLGTLVLAMSFRHAGVLARMADTVQEISGGRLVLGIGAGWHEPEYRAFGLPFEDRVTGFEEAAAVLTRMLREGRATLAGRHHRVLDAPVRARPGRPAPEILIAAKKPRMLRLTAAHADSWNLAWFGLPGERFRRTNAELDEECVRAGRAPSAVRRTVGVLVHETAPERAADEVRRVSEDGRPVLARSQDVMDALTAWCAEGVDEVILNPAPATERALAITLDAVRVWKATSASTCAR